MRIQHNIMAMNAYRNYNINTSKLSGNLEKLSSGYKINRAGDDAAGLAISEKMRAQITGLNAAQKNVKDGISLVKTAEGAMQEIQDMLNRMDYLATQSANGTYQNEVDRENLQKEVDALTTEINRIADSANFNGIKLLDGSLSTAGPANADGSMSVNLKACGHYQLYQDGVEEQEPSFDINVKQFVNGLSATASLAANATIGTVSMKIGDQTVTFKLTAQSAIAKGAAIDVGKVNITCSATSVSFSQGGNTMKMTITKPTNAGTGTFSFAKAGSVANVDFDANMDVKFSIAGSAKLTKTGDGVENCRTQNVTNGVAMKNDQLAHGGFQLTSAIVKALEKGGTLKIDDVDVTFDKDTKNANSTGTEVGIKDLLDANGNLKTDDETIKLLATSITRAANTNSAFTVGVGADGKTITLQEKKDYHNDANKDTYLYTDEQFAAKVSYTGGDANAQSGALVLQIGDTGDSFNQMSVAVKDMHAASLGIDKVNIGTQDGAKQAIQTIKDAINTVSATRGDLGAVQNRLEHTQNNLSVMAENIQDAESTIRDTDVAEEMMSYVKNNILVQSAQAMLAQANQVPQGVLQLLG